MGNALALLAGLSYALYYCITLAQQIKIDANINEQSENDRVQNEMDTVATTFGEATWSGWGVDGDFQHTKTYTCTWMYPTFYRNMKEHSKDDCCPMGLPWWPCSGRAHYFGYNIPECDPMINEYCNIESNFSFPNGQMAGAVIGGIASALTTAMELISFYLSEIKKNISQMRLLFIPIHEKYFCTVDIDKLNELANKHEVRVIRNNLRKTLEKFESRYEEKYGALMRMSTFLMGGHERFGKASTIRNALMNDPLYDSKVLGYIYSYIPGAPDRVIDADDKVNQSEKIRDAFVSGARDNNRQNSNYLVGFFRRLNNERNPHGRNVYNKEEIIGNIFGFAGLNTPRQNRIC